MSTTPLDDYGDPLPPAALARLGTLRLRHWPAPFGCFALRDGSLLTIAAQTFRLWDAATGKLVRALNEPLAAFRGQPGSPLMYGAMAMSRDGRWLAIDCRPRLLLWDTTDWSIRWYALQLDEKAVVLGFHGDGALLTVVYATGRMESYACPDGRRLHNQPACAGALAGAGLSPTEPLAVLCHQDGELRAVNVITCAECWRGRAAEDRTAAVGFSPDGQFVALGSGASSMLSVFASATGTALWQVQAAEGGLRCVAFSPDGRYLACGSQEGKAQVWDVASGRLRWETEAESSAILHVVFATSGRQLFALTLGSAALCAWDAQTGAELLPPHGNTIAVEGLALAPSTGQLALAGRRTVTLWEPATQRLVRRLHGPMAHTTRVAFSPDGRYLAAGDFAHAVHLWELQTGHHIALRGHTSEIVGLCFLQGGRLLASLESSIDRGLVLLWDVAQGKPVKKLEGAVEQHLGPEAWEEISEQLREDFDESQLRTMPRNPITHDLENVFPNPHYTWQPTCIAAAPAHGLLAYGGLSYEYCGLNLCNVADGSTTQLREKGKNPSIDALACSPDGRLLAAGGRDRTIWLWDVAARQVQHRLKHSDKISSLTFSHDNRLLASGGEYGTIHLWSVADGKELRLITGHGGAVHALGFTADNRTLLSGSIDGTVLFWDVASLAATT